MESKNNKRFLGIIYIKNILQFIVLPVILEIIIEAFNRASIIKSFKFMIFSPVQFICNTIFVAITVMVGLMLKRRVFYLCLVSFIWILMGITNRILLAVRVTPFNAMDLKLIDTARTILDQYFSPVKIAATVAAIAMVVVIMFIIFLKAPKVEYKINFWKNFALFCVAIIVGILCINVATSKGYLAKKFPNLTSAYQKYGFVYCFEQGFINHGVKKPSDYSKNKIDKIIDKLGSSKDDATADINKTNVKKKPNIIFLQLESFFDINMAKDIKFNQDPIPYFNSLRQQYTSGYLNVFNVGYGTCNTEFEIMTSMNLDDFGPGEFPYKTVLRNKTVESIAYDLKEYGYRTHAIHNNDATFYSRKTVFKNLGYDTFTSIEYMNVNEYTYEGWAKDKVLTNEILKAIKENDAPDYIYTISVQGHGSYPTSKVLENPEIQVVSGVENEGRKNAIEYYSNQIHEMDQFIKELTDALQNCGEDTILVMYGDHLPGLGFSESDLTNNSIYQTEYVIWNNFGMAKEDEDVETYQLAPKVMKSLGMTAGVINKYHQTNKDSEEYLSGLQNLEYDILYGNQLAYNKVSPYKSTDLQMGIDKISIDEIQKLEENDTDYVVVKGKNFNKSSRVMVNDKTFDTEFIDTSTLRIKYDKLASLDSFVVAQVDKDSGYVVGKTKESLYYGSADETETTETSNPESQPSETESIN